MHILYEKKNIHPPRSLEVHLYEWIFYKKSCGYNSYFPKILRSHHPAGGSHPYPPS